jgi:hypothetical protein
LTRPGAPRDLARREAAIVVGAEEWVDRVDDVLWREV